MCRAREHPRCRRGLAGAVASPGCAAGPPRWCAYTHQPTGGAPKHPCRSQRAAGGTCPRRACSLVKQTYVAVVCRKSFTVCRTAGSSHDRACGGYGRFMGAAVQPMDEAVCSAVLPSSAIRRSASWRLAGSGSYWAVCSSIALASTATKATSEVLIVSCGCWTPWAARGIKAGMCLAISCNLHQRHSLPSHSGR